MEQNLPFESLIVSFIVGHMEKVKESILVKVIQVEQVLLPLGNGEKNESEMGIEESEADF